MKWIIERETTFENNSDTETIRCSNTSTNETISYSNTSTNEMNY